MGGIRVVGMCVVGICVCLVLIFNCFFILQRPLENQLLLKGYRCMSCK